MIHCILVFAVSGSGLNFRDSGLRRSQSRDPGIFSGLVIRQDFLVTREDWPNFAVNIELYLLL